MLSEEWSSSAPACSMVLGENNLDFPWAVHGRSSQNLRRLSNRFCLQTLKHSSRTRYLVNFKYPDRVRHPVNFNSANFNLSSLEPVNCSSSLLQIHLGVSSKPGGLKALCAAHASLEFSVEFSKSGFMTEMCAKPEIYWLSYGYNLPHKPVSRADWKVYIFVEGIRVQTEMMRERELI